MQAQGSFSIVTMTKQASSTPGRQKGWLQPVNRSTRTCAAESCSHRERRKTSPGEEEEEEEIEWKCKISQSFMRKCGGNT